MSHAIAYIYRATESARSTFFRFPVTLVSAFLLTGILWYLASDFIEFDSTHPLSRVALVLVYFVMMSVVVTLISESWRWKSLWKNLLIIALAVDAIGFYFLFPADLDIAPAFHIVRWGIVVLAAFVLTFVAGHIRTQPNELSFWSFLWALISRLFVTIVFSFILFVGISLAIASLDILFGFDLDEVWYFRVWLVVVGVFGQWFYLAGFPTKYDVPVASYPRFLKVLTMYIGVPIVSVYLFILYAYSGKILFTGVWPEGEIVWLMLAFLLVGFVVTLFAYPLFDLEKNPIYLWLQRGFFIATLPLMIVYFMAIRFRILEYGWTDNRYIIVAFGVWIVISALLFLFHRRDIRWIFGSFILIAVISVTLIPFRMFDVGIRSQTDRLMQFFESHDMIQNGQIVASDELIDIEYSAQSIVTYLHNRGALDDVLENFAKPIDLTGIQSWEIEDTVLLSLNVRTYSHVDETAGKTGRILIIDENLNERHDISGFSEMVQFRGHMSTRHEDAIAEKDRQILVSPDGLTLTLLADPVRTIPIGDILRETLDDVPQMSVYTTEFADGSAYRIIFEYANGEYDLEQDKWEYLDYNGWLLLSDD